MILDTKIINSEIDKILPRIIAIRREIHRHPELSEQEEDTCSLISSALSEENISHHSHICGHGVWGTVYGRDRKHGVAVRADIDALPITELADVPFKSVNNGVMHACGHDIHTAVLLGTAFVLNNIKDILPGSVRLIFQPSEETIGGAKQMIDSGCLGGMTIKSVIGLHVESSIDAGAISLVPGMMNAASCEFLVKVSGKSCHGAHPDAGTDPLLPACAMVASIQSIITRNIDPTQAALITVGRFNSGTKNNIIPGETVFSGIIRALKLEIRTSLKEKLTAMCRSIAESYGASAEITYKDSYPPLGNDADLLSLVKESAETAIGRDNVHILPGPSMGTDDFAYFCRDTRGLYFNLGVRTPGAKETYPIHNDKFNPDEACIRTGILTETAAVLRILEEEKTR